MSADSGAKRASALDGIRGIALACPIVVHLGIVGSDRGLWLAIGMFFTLSAFLVTTLALREIDSTGTLGLGGFWMRRIRRLLPASLLVLLLTVIVAWWIDWPGLSAVKGDVLSALVWGANWEQLNGGGYWDSFSPSLTHHFWSLSFEEQVYIFFPLLIVGLVAVRRRRPTIRFATLLTIPAMAILAMSWTYLWSVDDASTLYLSTWSRLGEIAFGIIAACVSHMFATKRLSVAGSSIVITMLMAAIAPFWVFAAGDTPGGIRAGITCATPLTAVVIAMLWRHPQSLPSRFFSLRVPAWLGRRSYGVYLLHLPIIDFMSYKLGHEHLPRLWMIVAVATTIIGAGVMFRWFEEPFRIGEFVPRARTMVVGMAMSMVTVLAAVLVLVRDDQPLLAIPPTVGPPPTSPVGPTSSTSTIPGQAPAEPTIAPAFSGTALVVGDSTAWVTTGAVDAVLKPLGYTTSEVHMVGCAFGGDVRLKTSVMGGEVRVREMGEEPGCDEWWNTYLPQWLESVQPTVVTIIGGYGLTWEIDPEGDDNWCHIGDGSGRCDEWARARVAATTDLIAEYAPDATIIWMTAGHVDPWGPLDISTEAIDGLNSIITAEVERTNTRLIDLGPWLDDHLDLTVDGTHLGADGVAALVPWLDERLAPLVPQ